VIVNTVEVGLKSTMANRRMRFNLAVFYQDYRNKQERSIKEGALVVTTADRVRGGGAEAEVSAYVAKGLRADLAVGYMNLEYKGFFLGDIDMSGQPVQKVPNWNITFSPTYTARFAHAYRLQARVDIQYTSRVYNDLLNTELIARRPATVIGARVAVSTADSRYTIALWGKNLTDEIVFMHGYVFSWGNQVMLNPPRMVGIEFRLRI